MIARALLILLLIYAAIALFVAPAVHGSGVEADLRNLPNSPRGQIAGFPVFADIHSGHLEIQVLLGKMEAEVSYYDAVSYADSGASLRNLSFSFLVSRYGDLGVAVPAYYAVRPIIVNRYGNNSGLYYLSTDNGGRDVVRRYQNEGAGYPPSIGQENTDCQCSSCTLTYNINAESFREGIYHPAGSGFIASDCADGRIYGVMFDEYLLAPIYKPFACNTGGALGFSIMPPGAVGFQCAGPVYRPDGALIWPEACFALGDTVWDSFPSYTVEPGLQEVQARNRKNHTPFFFDVPVNQPIRIRNSGPAPSLRDFSYALGQIRYRLLDDRGNPIGGWVTVNGRGVIMVPVGVDRIEIQPPSMARFADRYERDSSTDSMKAFRAQIAVARLDTGRWQVVWDSGVVFGNGPAPQPPSFVLRGLSDVRGEIVIRGVGGWWRNGPGGVLWTKWFNVLAYDVNPGFFSRVYRQDWTDKGWNCASFGPGRCDAGVAQTFRYNASNAEAYLFDGGPKGASIRSPMGWEITGTSFQVFLASVPYEVREPSSPPQPQAAALQRDLLSGVESSGHTFGLPVDRIHQAGVRYTIPEVYATLVFTDELGSQSVRVRMDHALITSTIQHPLGLEETVRMDAGLEASHWFTKDFYAMDRGAPPSPDLIVGPPASGSAVRWSLRYRLYGDVTVWYRFRDGTTQPIALRVFLPREGAYEASGSIPVLWLREER